MTTPVSNVYRLGLSILDFSPQQRRSFLAQIRRNQCEIIRQVATNVLLNSSMILSDSERSYFKKKQGILRQLASKRICMDDKRELLPKYSSVVKQLMKVAVRYINEKLNIRDHQKQEENGGQLKSLCLYHI